MSAATSIFMVLTLLVAGMIIVPTVVKHFNSSSSSTDDSSSTLSSSTESDSSSTTVTELNCGSSSDSSTTTESSNSSDSTGPVITISDGKIRGQVNTTIGGNNTFYSFRGIPYAKPPVGDLRFAAPVKNSPWCGTLDATAEKSECIQSTDPVEGSEDCLYINVFTPSLTKNNLSVIVWIYGGAFTSGNNSYALYTPDYLLDEGVIVVSLNYRLGVFGFLSTEDETCSGNWGLKDQVLALKWVQENINYFGGNPQNVTIFGESAGSVSVSILLQTNQTKGLFKSAIMDSGTSLNLWARNTRASTIAFAIGAALFKLSFTSSSLISNLRNVDADDLQTTSNTVSNEIFLQNGLAGLAWAPVIEPVHEGALFVNRSDELMRNGGFQKVPILMGFNSNEASAVGDIPALLRAYILRYEIAAADYAPINLTQSTVERALAGTRIRTHYFGILPVVTQDDAIINFISDDQFVRPIREAALQMSNYTDVYLYEFSYQGNLSGITNRNFTGVGHSEELKYIFATKNNATDLDKLVRLRMCRMWTNFAKYSNPTPNTVDTLLLNVTWPIVNGTDGNLKYMNISSVLKVEQNPDKEGMDFYSEIYETYGEPPYATY